MPEAATYLFAVAAADRLDQEANVRELPAQFGPVRTIFVDGLVAIVSTYSGPTIEDVPQSELMAHLLLHQQVIEDLGHTDGVLPVRIGAVFDDDDEVERLLRGSAPVLGASLQHSRGMVEIDVAATWQIDEILAECAVDPEVSDARSAAMQGPTEVRSAAALGVGRLVAEKLGKRRGELELRVLKELEPYAKEARPNAVASDTLVCDIALLVEQDEARHIDEALHRLDAEFDGRLNFRSVGPLPPYSFATVRVHRVTRDEIERAVALLALGSTFDLASIFEQYRQLALTRHPDVLRANPQAAKDFEDLTWARATLASVCQNLPDCTRVPWSDVFFATVGPNTRRN